MSQSTPPAAAQSKAFILIAQIFISCLMALMMTFLMSILPMGFGPGWFGLWISRWLTAWPVAFVLSLGVGPVAFKLSGLVLFLRARAAGRA
ncbi:DUF2798 domain-containing protein [Pseudooceanicola sp. 200-1SW]|uniref:DUF2798 domain-containing protein n=1 Tax=Pseudooceanicola sp. 200-1SW TaxID=3425949 RepID=UPI003D7F78B7